MAYENVNINKMRSALNKLDNIKSSSAKLDKLLEDLNPFWGITWDSVTKQKIEDALITTKACYNQIEKIIDNGKLIANDIKEYQDLKDDNDDYARKIKNLKNQKKLYSYSNSLTGGNSDSIKQKILKIEADIKTYNNKINTNKNRMIVLQNQINGRI